MQVIYFLILIGVLVFIHEFGHFFFAKLFDVRVNRFAIGMGPVVPFLSFTRGETEYSIRAFPLGGYVQMYGMQPEELYDEYGERVPEELAQRAFVRKPIWQRSIIVFAGPLMNFVFPVIVYFFFALGTSQSTPAQIGQVFTANPASQAVPSDASQPVGLQPGDTIVSIDGEPIRYWRDLTDTVREAANQTLRVHVKRGEKTLEYSLTPKPHTQTDRLGLMREEYGLIGVSVESYSPIVHVRSSESPAAKAGLQTFDRIVAVNGNPVKRFVDVQNAVRTSQGKPMTLSVVRPEPVKFLAGGLTAGKPLSEMKVTPVASTTPGEPWSLGLEPAEMTLSYIEAESPAAQAGLQVGDTIVGLSNCTKREASTCGERKLYNNMRSVKVDIQQRLWEAMHNDKDNDATKLRVTFQMTVQRGDEEMKIFYTPVIRMIQGSFNEPVPEIWFGLDTYVSYELPEPIPVPWGDRLALGVEQGFSQTWRFTHMMFNGILHLFQGKVSTDTVGGPIMIFDIAGKAGKAGWEPFLRMMAIISINLGLVNLLPIPLLDGGHLMLFTIEAIKRKELTARTRQIAYYIGLGAIIFLMLLAFKNDIERYWQNFADWFNG